MTSYLIVSKDREQQKEYTAKILTEHSVHQFDITYASSIMEKNDGKKKSTPTRTTKSIGISDIKKLQRKLYLKPIKGTTKAIIIEDAETLTTEAQNALLKVLEEPPAQTIIILQTAALDALLPTIHSRCQIVELSSKTEFTNDQKQEIFETVESLDQLTIQQALLLAENYAKNKEDLLTWLATAIIVLHEKMQENKFQDRSYHHYAPIIKRMQKLHTIIATTNSNIRHATEIFFLSFTEESLNKH